MRAAVRQNASPRGDVRLFSAPGEGRECVEIARRILEEARAGVAFDEIAVFVRSPQRYAGLLEHAFKRAGIPALVRSRHEPAASGGPRLPRDPRLRRAKSSRRDGLRSTSRSRRFRNLTGERREFDFVVPDDDVLGAVTAAARRIDGDSEQPADAEESERAEPRSVSRRFPVHGRSGRGIAARAVEMGNADRRVGRDWRRSPALASPACRACARIPPDDPGGASARIPNRRARRVSNAS